MPVHAPKLAIAAMPRLPSASRPSGRRGLAQKRNIDAGATDTPQNQEFGKHQPYQAVPAPPPSGLWELIGKIRAGPT